jgi:DNA end-binding protein Ku
MTELSKVAIGRVVIRQKERLVAIRPVDGVLVVETMRYADEVLPRDGLAGDLDAEITDRELTMARQLVESLSVDDFEPERFRDEYREQVLDLIERKAAGEEIVATPEAEAPSKVLDLVAALEASLAKSKGAKQRHPSAGSDADDSGQDDAADEAPAKAPAKKRSRRTA